MSKMEEIFINSDNEVIIVDLSKLAALELFEYLLPYVARNIPEFKYQFEGVALCGILAIDDMTKSQFNTIYPAIMQACDTIESLVPYKAELKEKLEADERFEAMQKA